MNSDAQSALPAFGHVVPVHVRRIILAGARLRGQDQLLQSRGMEVLACDLDCAGLPTDTQFDAVALDGMGLAPDVALTLLRRLVPVLSPHGLLLCVDGPSTVTGALEQLGFAASDSTDCALEGTRIRVVRALRCDYSLREHARRLRAEGRPDLAFCVLREVSLQQLPSDEEAAALAVETQVSLLDLDGKTRGAGRLPHFWLSQMAFYQCAARAPGHALAYQCQAEFWRRIGSPEMGRRLLRSVERIAPSAAAQQQRASYEGKAEAAPRPIPDPPEWDRSWKPRVLFITHPRIDYGLDTLCDGLRRVLGDGRFVEYPWKPSLHGDVPPRLANYPCCFNHPGSPTTLDAVLAQLRGGEFDLLLFGDTELNIDRDEARRIAQAATIPWVLIDQGDDPLDRRAEAMAYLARSDMPICFKREMLACHDYGDNFFPLPFAYPDGRIPAEVSETRDNGLFWAGHRQFGLRRLYLECLEAIRGRRFDANYTQEEYARALSGSRIGLSLFGGGFDTVRYWELPAHGCMLLAERPPIRIPYDFEDGVSALFFGDVPEFEARLDQCLSKPELVGRVAAAGHDRLRRYHTAPARAAQILTRLSRNATPFG
ncbi:MAG: glycosyltransferase [FCB group bacterium]|nr:glycosyltransferase [FCB group bacterium]